MNEMTLTLINRSQIKVKVYVQKYSNGHDLDHFQPTDLVPRYNTIKYKTIGVLDLVVLQVSLVFTAFLHD